MNFGSPTMWKNGVLLPTYPTFVVLKNHPFSTIFIGGGISIFSNFYQNFWSIFWTLRRNYPILLAITLHFGAGGFYAYVLKISIFWAFLGRENMGQLFLYIYIYHCCGNSTRPKILCTHNIAHFYIPNKNYSGILLLPWYYFITTNLVVHYYYHSMTSLLLNYYYFYYFTTIITIRVHVVGAITTSTTTSLLLPNYYFITTSTTTTTTTSVLLPYYDITTTLVLLH
ncbi:hypothetical protein PFUGPA_02705 [Plasmodium falciparum Palo Alto/Uganda]|uniref:Uncharacterized protein n=1 Tax=Plasmodium falciparum (isolate Palo Alto / Uganda) TaxID=57270 RepID=W4J115_PLAFP|nr:hypothetical protein PFUGPA_02705 [Plasmodium falciparum Palo Alto/Uganda]